MLVERITQINNNVFDIIYDANSASIVENTGYDDKENLRKTFTNLQDNFYLFSFTKDGEVVGYVQGFANGTTLAVYNSVTKSTDVFVDAVTNSSTILKSLGFTHLQVACTNSTPMHNWTKASCNRIDLFEYESESEQETFIAVRLRLL
tara:strand:- start:58 stop:501 length:444 start_codon:yes stop_codon:yes gene_type:complete